jgi:hypothetical protein
LDTSRCWNFGYHGRAESKGFQVVTRDEYLSGLEIAAERYRSGSDMDSILLALRRLGFTPIDCIRCVVDVSGCALADAVRTVHFSSAWPEIRD